MSITSVIPGTGDVVSTMAGAAREKAEALRFAGILLFACLILQRFGLPMGGRAFSIVGPIGMALAGFYVLRGTLAFDRFRLICYLMLATLAMFGLAWNSVLPGRTAQAPNFQSLLQFLFLTAFATLTFIEAVSEHAFFRLVNQWFAFIAIAGIIQFFLQFIGLGLFKFTGLLPEIILFESGYNLVIPIGVGSLLKSNGFFIIEPSTFSQVMALAVVIEVMAFRRPVYFFLFVTGLLLSLSGTGWIVLASFVAAAAIGMGWRGIAISLATVLILGIFIGAAAYLAPNLAGSVGQRTSEISRPGTSGHRRFVTPFWILDDVMKERPSAAIVGIGAGVSERLTPVYDYDVNTPVKISIEFGFPAFLAYLLLFIGGRKSPIQRALLVPACVMFFVAGAYQQFPPVLFMILLLVSVARLQVEPAAR